MKINKIFKTIIILLIIIVISFLLLFELYNENYKLSKKIEDIWNRYEIWYLWQNKVICDKVIKKWCLEGNILNYKTINNIIYIYFEHSKWFSINFWYENYTKKYWLFWPYDNYWFNEIEEIPNLMKLDIYKNWIKEYYNTSNIDKINENDKKIFNELIK